MEIGERYTKNLQKIVAACDELGWLVGVGNVSDMVSATEGESKGPTGLIIGPRDYIEQFFPEVIIDPEINDIIRDRHDESAIR